MTTTVDTYDKLVPRSGDALMKALVEVNKPSHPHHLNYEVGRREGKEYVIALIEQDEATLRERALGFREFVARNYLNRHSSN